METQKLPKKKDQSKFEKPLKTKQMNKRKIKLNKEEANGAPEIEKRQKRDSSVLKNGAGKDTKKGGLKRKRNQTAQSDGTEAKKVKLESMTVKERRNLRKSGKNNFDISHKAKKLWETLRREDCSKVKQVELANEVHSLIKGKVDTLVLAHDTVRVVECLMICGTDQIKTDLFEETKDKLLFLMKSKYAKHFVMKILKYGTKQQRETVMQAMHKKVVRLVLHTEAAEVVEMAYNEFANLKQRQELTMEFYGTTFALFKDKQISSLQQLLESEPAQRETILSYMKETLTAMMGKAVLRHSIVHHVLLEYMNNCNVKDREEMIETIREKVVEILHTKDGARVGLKCVWHGTAKDRKALIKSMRGHATKICMEESGYLVLLSMFDCVDDTKLIQKILIEEILQNAGEIALHGTGRKVLLYLTAPRKGVYFHPDIIKIINEGDSNSTSKKDSEIRRRELLAAVGNGLIKMIAENTEKLVACPEASLLIQTVIKNCPGDHSGIFDKIAELAAKPLEVGSTTNPHIVESAAGHRLLKNLIKNDKERPQTDGAVLFSETLLKAVSDENLVSWIECNRGSFILLSMIESEIIPVIKQVTAKLSSALPSIKKKKYKGAELLYTKLKSLEN